MPSVSRQISSAVVRRWISGLAGFLNCWGMKELGVFLISSSALRTAPGIPSEAGVKTISAPNALINLRRSRLMLSGMVTTRRYPRAAHVNASAIPVLPLVGSITTVSLVIRPSASAASIIATPIRSLTDQRGLKFSSFATTSA